MIDQISAKNKRPTQQEFVKWWFLTENQLHFYWAIITWVRVSLSDGKNELWQLFEHDWLAGQKTKPSEHSMPVEGKSRRTIWWSQSVEKCLSFQFNFWALYSLKFSRDSWWFLEPRKGSEKSDIWGMWVEVGGRRSGDKEARKNSFFSGIILPSSASNFI